MANLTKVEKQLMLGMSDIVRFQIITYCFVNTIQINCSELDCLTLLALNDNQELGMFCQLIYQKNIYASVQAARNAVQKTFLKGLLLKTGKKHKRIVLNPDIQVQSEGNILLEYKIAHITPT